MSRIPQTDPPKSPRETLPTMYDLPSEYPGEPGMPDVFHLMQPSLLSETFCPPECKPDEFFVASDLNIYYDVRHTNWYKRPDWFAALGVPRLYDGEDLRLSYVIWQEGISPTIVVELLSPGTEKEDLGQRLRNVSDPPSKWEVYERILRVPYYVVFDRYTDNLKIFKLAGACYEEVIVSQDGRFWIPPIQMALGMWEGTYQSVARRWLRWCDAKGNWIPTAVELLAQEQERSARERERAERERERAERLASRLRSLGEDPNEL
jgi:Uma2 family endonuclease